MLLGPKSYFIWPIIVRNILKRKEIGRINTNKGMIEGRDRPEFQSYLDILRERAGIGPCERYATMKNFTEAFRRLFG